MRRSCDASAQPVVDAERHLAHGPWRGGGERLVDRRVIQPPVRGIRASQSLERDEREDEPLDCRSPEVSRQVGEVANW